MLSLSKEKERMQFSAMGIGYSLTRYIAMVETASNLGLASPQYPIYALAEAGVAWREQSGAIVEATQLINNLWRLVIDPARPIPDND